MGKKTFYFALALAALTLFAALAAYLRTLERSATRDAAALVAQPSPADSAAPKAPDHLRILGLLRSSKLITVELTSVVSSRLTDQSWRGDVEASITAPVRYHYGVDLGALSDRALEFDALRGRYTLRVPEPQRLATEVFGQEEDSFVAVGWGRLRSRAGEYYLGQARRRLYTAAREATLSDADRDRVNDLSRTQLAHLVRTLSGEPAPVEVEFERPITDAGVPR